MPSYARLDEVEKIDMADRALRALGEDDEMLARMGKRGYKQKRLDAGRALAVAARKARRTQDAELGEQFGATDDAGEAWAAVRKPFVKEFKLAREALAGDRDALEDLGLLDRLARSRVATIDQAHNFYSSALAREDTTGRLDEYGIDKDVLTAGLDRVEAIAAARGTQQGEREGAKTATKKKGTVLDDLNRWMAPFLRVARAEFADEPERLARLGL